MNSCVFCEMEKNNCILENEKFYAIFDKYPVTEGHLLIIPKRHVQEIFALNKDELSFFAEILLQGKEYLEKSFLPNGFNIGINQGEAAGQTIPHLHIHLIPRYTGDMEKPEGGVRGVIPEKRLYRLLVE